MPAGEWRSAPRSDGADLERFASMHERLRRATGALHKRVEAAVAIEMRLSSVPCYAELLGSFFGLYRAIERALAAPDWDPTGIDLGARRKTSWLEADLRHLGRPDLALETPFRSPALPPLPDRAAALGWLYVTEGATLGGRIILRQAALRLGVDAGCGGRFFAGYGAQTAAMWRAFLAELNGVAPHSPPADRVEAAAVRLFATFEASMTEPPAGVRDLPERHKDWSPLRRRSGQRLTL